MSGSYFSYALKPSLTGTSRPQVLAFVLCAKNKINFERGYEKNDEISRHLFGNEALAQMLLGRIGHMRGFNQYVQIFPHIVKCSISVHSRRRFTFFRFAPAPEKDLNNVVAEIEFLDYLKKMQYPAVEAIDSPK